MQLLSSAQFPFGTRLLIDLINAGELPMIVQADIEPVYGYVGRLVYEDGTVRFFRNSNKGINNHGASAICTDKGYTKYFLDHLGYRVPGGETFLAADYAALIDTNLSQYGEQHYNTPDHLLAAVADLGYPCVIKPNSMTSGGKGVFICYDAEDVQTAVKAMLDDHVDVFLLEEHVPYVDYRLVVFDGVVRLAYQRKPLQIMGDGDSTIADLLADKRQKLWAQNRRVQLSQHDPRLLKKLRYTGRTLQTVLPADETYQVYDAANASLGGDVADMLDNCHPHWVELAEMVALKMGLRLCGIDLLCADITRPDAAYVVLEINASPGMVHYTTLGDVQYQRVRDLYRDMFRARIV
ncbi:ATP-grasp domain-containing protein [Phototrophicus methaneseepsis]|uniref:ATP-grasp domain-containing protein n=1 Tax=Phototrophicus methaneseepsis TaxID=2710758 RepID=A0A7S8EDP0_9CHLR|nr:ATP-grasp domain-containing protein [Phototrophicus methaneseepsis]QPC85031.1 ATP-grasp domain-containing protein [Phototrophicus methaneseepsis]